MRILPTISVVAAAAVLCTVSEASAGHHRNKADVTAVKKVVVDAYVDGVHAKRNTAAMRAGFHQSFIMMIRGDDGEVRQLTRDQWIARMDGAKPLAKPAPKVRHKFLMVDITGDVAVAKIAMYRDGTHILTDYMSLYRTPSGWKIVAKAFQPHRR